ncbi:MAG: two pore domain potassium channel family protein [Bacteroidaceae bacterium]|nr:two pore domain potassium channel family protein [Bacteroidaceae bacterium]MBR3860247.1 two pore domain potassium channel family protein [Bacteroidaceae bacterium]MBR3984939.1 two pore domain potassium channel family protein [Bacteroidaceae bacterium]
MINKQSVQLALHLSAFVLSLLLVISISIDTFAGTPFYNDTNYLDLQFWICILLIILFSIEVYNAEHSWQYFGNHFLFLLLIIPYLTLFDWFDVTLSSEMEFLFRFIPLIRGYIAFTIIAYGLLRDLTAGLLITYIVILFSFIYYSSLIFYVLEANVNPMVHNFWDCLWYSCMTATTAGCSIQAVTTVGKVISVLLSLSGMMLLPVFTVYLTDIIRTGHITKNSET